MRPPTPRECSTGHAGAENTNTPPDDTIIYAADTRHKRDCSTRSERAGTRSISARPMPTPHSSAVPRNRFTPRPDQPRRSTRTVRNATAAVRIHIAVSPRAMPISPATKAGRPQTTSSGRTSAAPRATIASIGELVRGASSRSCDRLGRVRAQRCSLTSLAALSCCSSLAGLCQRASVAWPARPSSLVSRLSRAKIERCTLRRGPAEEMPASLT